MRAFSVLVLILCLCATVLSVLGHWDGIQFEERFDRGLENWEDARVITDGHLILSPSVQKNFVFTVLPPPEEEESVDPEYSHQEEPQGFSTEGISNEFETTANTATTQSDCTCSGLEEKVDQLLSKLKDQENKILLLESGKQKLLEKIDQVEQQTKVNNVIFLNVRETKNENSKSTLQKVIHVLNRMMKLRINSNDISVALRVDSKSTKIRPIVVKFTKFETKMRVLSARNKLNGSIIDISSDYSELVSERRKALMPFLFEKRSQGHKAFILYDKLLVDGVKMSLEELQSKREEGNMEEPEVPEDINPEEGCSEITDSEDDLDKQVEVVEVDPDFLDSE